MSESKLAEGKDDDGSLVEMVRDFCMSSKLESEFEDFAREHADVFSACLELNEGEEHPHEFHSIYQKYLSKFEGEIEDFIRSTGYSVSDFYKECQRILEKEELFGSNRFFVETILATSEYENFYMLMRAEMTQHRRANRGK